MSSHAEYEPLCHTPHHPTTNGKLIKILARIISFRQSHYFYHLLQSLNNFTPFLTALPGGYFRGLEEIKQPENLGMRMRRGHGRLQKDCDPPAA